MNLPKLIKTDGTPSGEWVSLIITLLPYPILIIALFQPWIPLKRVMQIGGLVTAFSVIIWGGYMGKKTVIEFGKLKVQMNGGKNGNGQTDPLDNRGGDSVVDNTCTLDSVNYPVKPIRQGKGRGK